MLEIVCSQNNNGKAVVQTAPEKTENSLRRLGVLKDEEKHGEDMKKWITKKGYVIYQVLSGRCNCFIVSNGSKFLLVDTGGRKKQRLLLNRLAKLRRNGESAAGIILTHAHFDHTENAAAIKAACNSGCPASPGRSLSPRRKNPPIRGTFRMIRFLTNLFGKRLEDFYQYAAVDADFPVHEYYDLSAWGFEIVLLHTPDILQARSV
jgi:glyoxylase-like metal-dependent hydrolase (beta-lactamase superfamily II)